MTALLEHLWCRLLRRSGMHLVEPWIEDMAEAIRR